MKVLALSGAAVAAMTTFAASAAPLPMMKQSGTSAVEQVQGWRYHRGCGWDGRRWVVDLGAGRIVVCRPNRPGRDWVWRSDGPRQGWWNPRRRHWHHDGHRHGHGHR